MTLDKKQARAVGKLLALPAEAVEQLQIVPYKGSLPTAVPVDPLIYRFYEPKSGSYSRQYRSTTVI